VGATENAILAACGAEGVTTISNAAREPEICDLQDFLCAMGADVRGAGSSTVTVTGGRRLHGCQHQVIADRIVAATYLAAAAGAGGDICLKDVQPRHLATVTAALQQAGCRITGDENTLRLESRGKLHSIPPVRTAPYPGFPTDAQAVLMAALLCSRGTTVFVENMFENRYRHVAELRRMGADVRPEGRVAVVCGVERLRGAQVHATDLRGGAALVVAGLQAEGTTQVGTIHHIQRGYADIVGDLSQLGAEIRRQDT
jgi:UDP-N-acetylglucosamine 1-carboxyvinyltransferase